MSSATLLRTAPSVHYDQGPSRLAINRLGLWLFIISESCLFATLLASRFYLTGLDRPEGLNQTLGLAITAVLLVSSLTAYRAEAASASGDQAGFRRNLLMTLALGGLFVVGVGLEWAEGFHYFPPQSTFGTVFFTLTGLHAFHVLSGLLALALVYRHGRHGRYGPGKYWAVEGTVKYWHFVDVAWVFIYPTLYLVS
ncbi:MAG: heme-copper oxidase subunit III [Chloroflexi bacterium]|nr:heme-copper oxidase subunit III [Chloroflexota bacterium]